MTLPRLKHWVLIKYVVLGYYVTMCNPAHRSVGVLADLQIKKVQLFLSAAHLHLIHIKMLIFDKIFSTNNSKKAKEARFIS